MLSSDSDPVKKELGRRQKAGDKSTQFNVGSFVSIYKERGLRWGETDLPADVMDNPWVKTLAAIQKWVLVFSDSERPFRPPALSDKPWDESMGALARDIGQPPSRIRYSKHANGLHVAGTQKPDQVVMLDVQPRRLQLGLESMLI